MLGNDETDGTNDNLCMCCGTELVMDGMRWGPICHAMIRPRTSRTMPSTNIRREDIEIVDKILDQHSPQATLSRLRALVNSFPEKDRSWAKSHHLITHNQKALNPAMSEEYAAKLRQHVFKAIAEDDIEYCQRLLRRGFPLPGGLWLTVLEGPGTPSTVVLDGKIQVSRSFPGRHLVKIMSKMEESQIASIDWDRFVKILCTLFPAVNIRRGRFNPFLRALGRRSRRNDNFCYPSVLFSQINELTGSELDLGDQRWPPDSPSPALAALPYAVERLTQTEYEGQPWLQQWRSATKDWCDPEFLKQDNPAMIQVRNGHLNIRIRSMSDRTKIRKLPHDLSVWQGIISAQLSPPGSPQHDRLWLLLENWNLDRVAPAVPDKPDQKAAKLVVEKVLKHNRINLLEKEQAIQIQGTSGASYLIKTKPRYHSRDSIIVSGSTPKSPSYQGICIHQTPEQLSLPIGDQIYTILTILVDDLSNHSIISTITEFLRRNDLLKSRNRSDWETYLQPNEGRRNLAYLQRRNRYLNALERRNANDQFPYLEFHEWDQQDGHLEHEHLPVFPLTDADLMNLEPHLRIPRLIANALVSLRESPIGAEARVPRSPGDSFSVLRLSNVYQSWEEIDLLRSFLPVCGWQLESDEDAEAQIWRRHTRSEWDRNAIFNGVAPIQEIHNPQGRPWWATIEEMVARFRNQPWAMRRLNHHRVEHESAED